MIPNSFGTKNANKLIANDILKLVIISFFSFRLFDEKNQYWNFDRKKK